VKPFERWSVWITSFLTVVSGTGYFVTKYLMTAPDPYAVVNSPLQPIFLKLHVLVSPLLLFALGLITVRHVWRHFRSGVRWSRKSGLTAALAVVPMVVTGYLIQVLTAAGWIRAMAIAHVVFGAGASTAEGEAISKGTERNFSGSTAKDRVGEPPAPRPESRERPGGRIGVRAGRRERSR